MLELTYLCKINKIDGKRGPMLKMNDTITDYCIYYKVTQHKRAFTFCWALIKTVWYCFHPWSLAGRAVGKILSGLYLRHCEVWEVFFFFFFFFHPFFYCLQNHIHISTKKSQMNMFKKPSTTELHLYKWIFIFSIVLYILRNIFKNTLPLCPSHIKGFIIVICLVQQFLLSIFWPN